ncbi:MAG: alpha-L-rhamnosidase C-terminal domain-containing protein [Armatimonadota bacterium]
MTNPLIGTPDPRVRRYVLPTRIVWQSDDDTVQESANLLANDTGQAIISFMTYTACQLRSRNGTTASVLLDFGRELHGGIQILIAHANRSHVAVRIRLGESVSEAMGDPNNDHALNDVTLNLPEMSAQEFGMTGFRFCRLDLLEDGVEAQIVSVRAVSLNRELEYVGAFRCSDERLNRIWEVGAYTVHLNMQDYVWDGIKRDRLVWLGDMHPETRVILSVFGADGVKVLTDSLDYARDRTPLPHWMNGMISYSFWWVLMQRDLYRYRGDLSYLDAQRAYLSGLLQQMAGMVDSEGREKLSGGARFLDWPTEALGEAPKDAGLHALLLMALDAGNEMSEALGETETAGLCRDAADRLRQYQPPLETGSKQAAALLALADLYPPSVVNETVLARDPLAGLSPFYGYYVLEARARAGDTAGALDAIRTFWGAMLDLGATTFWEHFDMAWVEGAARIDEITPPGRIDVHAAYGDYCFKGWRHSLCHGWSGGPTAWMTEHVLGLAPLEAGCRRVRVAPNLGDLEWAEGVLPTPLGPVHVRHERMADGAIRSNIDAPHGVTIDQRA